jgi:hypothetical protein
VEEAMSRQLQIRIEGDNDANHRALRRCCRCGSYARPFDDVNGAIRCERCAKRDRRARQEEEGQTDPDEVTFLV